jgi:hypothetical protein
MSTLGLSHSSLTGYHVDSFYDETNEKLVIKSIGWVHPEEDIAGMVDMLSTIVMFDMDSISYWLVSVSNSSGDSFSSTPMAELSHVALFHDEEDAQALVKKVEDVISGLNWASFTLPNDGYIQYHNDGYSKLLDISYMDGVFNKPDGVFLTKIEKKMVSRWAYDG